MVTTETRSIPSHPAVTVRPGRRTIVMALVLGAAGTVLSAAGSWIPSLWGDEVTSVLSSQRSFPSLFSMLGNVDAVHGTYYVLLHFWVNVFGASPFSVRFPSALAVGFMVAGVVFLGSRLGGLRMGVLAGVVALALPRTTYMGEEARGYALSAACAVWLTLLLVRLVTSAAPRRRWWVVYGVGVAVCGYVFLFSLLLLVAHAVLVLSLRRRSLTRSWLRAVALGVVFALPVILYGVLERGQVAFLAQRSDATFRDITVGQWFSNDTTGVVGWVLILAAIAVPLVTRVRGRLGRTTSIPLLGTESGTPRFMGLLVAWTLGPTVILVLVNSVHAIYSSRYLSFCAPAVALLIGSLLVRVRRTWLAAAVIVALAATAVGTYVQNRTPYGKNGSDWAAVASTIQANASAGDGIIFDETGRPSKDPRLAMGGYPQAFVGLKDIEIKSPWYDTTNWHDSVYPLSSVTDRLVGVHTLWVVEYRAPGTTADTYDLAKLKALGYTVTQTFNEHSSVILKMEN